MAVPTPRVFTAGVDCREHIEEKADQPHSGKKKIFVFCDGTGNEFINDRSIKSGNSNVVKLYTALRVRDEQVAYYHPGVGTLGDPTIRNPILRFWSKVKGLAFGSGFQANVLDAYRYLMETYNDGDDIYIFGFSRGAYTARALAGMLHGYGLLCKGNEGHLQYAWNMFHSELKKSRGRLMRSPHARGNGPAHSIQRNFAFEETYSRKVIIRFMGLWDTVSSVGWIYTPLRLLDMAQNPIVQVGRHAVSIDERRAFYRDNLWGPPVTADDPAWPEQLKEQGIQQDIMQVWFPGAHSDVGGSYPQEEAAPANETLHWMIGEVQNHGAQLCQERVDLILGKPTGLYSADKIYPPPPKPEHCIHDSLDWHWWLLQLFPQQYYDKEDGTILWRVPYGTPRSIPKGAVIHPSAEHRLRHTVHGEKRYRPRNLKLADLKPLLLPVAETTAELTGCFVYEPKKTREMSKTGVRLARLALGWLTFAIFWVLLFAAAWYVVSLFGIVLFFIVGWLIMHTPGIRELFSWGLCVLRHG